MPKGRFLHTSGHQFGSQRMAGKSPKCRMLCDAPMTALQGLAHEFTNKAALACYEIWGRSDCLSNHQWSNSIDRPIKCIHIVYKS